MKKYSLVEKNHGEETVVLKGTLEKIINYLKENPQIINWALDEDPNFTLPSFEDVETLTDLNCDLEKVNLGWWTLKVIEAEEEEENEE